MKKRAFLIVFIMMLLLTACVIEKSNIEDSNLLKVKVERVIDGDTIVVKVDGKEEKVRFLLIDTPELNHKDFNGPQPFAVEAKQFLSELIEGKSIELEMGISERDKYGRLLAWVFFEGKSVQELLLKNGYARVAYVYSPNVKYVDEYRVIQEEAQKKAVGIWSIENYATDKGFVLENQNGAPNEKPLLSQPPNDSCHIKGNINSKGEKIYHMPGGRYYEQTKPEVWFCSEEEAQQNGFRKPKQ